MDRRLWSGAAIAVTVVIAGANALPALLLSSPAADPSIVAVPVRPVEPPPVTAPALMSRPVSAAPVIKAESAPAAIAAPQPAPAATVATPQPALPASAAASPASVPPPTPAPPVPAPPVAETASAFPPVQPPTTEPPAAAPLVPPPRSARTAQAPEKNVQVETKERKRLRTVRPAIYPLREFFAWRR